MRLQLAVAREVVAGFDEAQESRLLEPREINLHKSFKLRVLGLASLERTIARQRSRILYLREGDANTRFFHLQACHRKRKNTILELTDSDGIVVAEPSAMAHALFLHFDASMGTDFQRSRAINLHAIGLPSANLDALESEFSEEEVRSVVMELPNDKAPGPDGLTGIFYKLCWDIIKEDLMRAFHAFWALDMRSLQHVNDALMILLRKKEQPA